MDLIINLLLLAVGFVLLIKGAWAAAQGLCHRFADRRGSDGGFRQPRRQLPA